MGIPLIHITPKTCRMLARYHSNVDNAEFVALVAIGN